MAGEEAGDSGRTAPKQDLALTGEGRGSNHYPVPLLCGLHSMKTPADPSKRAKLRLYSNHHHGTRGLVPTSGFAEALSSCPPPPASILQHRKDIAGHLHWGHAKRCRAGHRCRAQDTGLNIRVCHNRCTCQSRMQTEHLLAISICIALRREGTER